MHQVFLSLHVLHWLDEQERNIAIELEQKMMEDFEWKLREVEGGYKTKIKTLEEGLESKVTSYIGFQNRCPKYCDVNFRSTTTRGRSHVRRTQS